MQARFAIADVVACSVIAFPEAHGAVTRRSLEGAVSSSDASRILQAFRDVWPRYLAIMLSAPVYVRAGTLAIKQGLRGMDAIHLASWAQVAARGEEVEFLSHDTRLMLAAAKERRKGRRDEQSRRGEA